MSISIVIPTLNEEHYIVNLLEFLHKDQSYPLVKEILVVDGNSQDHTRELAADRGARVLVSSVRSRAVQMNLGAAQATGAILYFLHADTMPPGDFAGSIQQAVASGYKCGCFRLKFDWDHWFLTANSWFSRFGIRAFRYGDQSLFVERNLFHKVKGFREELALFEDHDMVLRLSGECSFKVLPDYVLTSARKYRRNGPFRLQLAYYCLYLLFALGFSQKSLLKAYRRLIPFSVL